MADATRVVITASLPEIRKQEHWFYFNYHYISVTEYLSDSPSSIRGIVLFLHGRFDHPEVWGPLAERLASHFRCFHVDLPCYGRSQQVAVEGGLSLRESVHLVDELLRRFSTVGEKIFVVGHDIGGAIAQLCALECQRKVSAMILLNSPLLSEDNPPLNWGLPQWGWIIRRKLQSLLKAAKSLSFEEQDKLMAPWKCRKCREPMIHSQRRWADSWPDIDERTRWKRNLSRLELPTLLLWGEHDPVQPPENAMELLNLLPEAYLYMNETCGHWPSLEQPDWVESRIREFIFRRFP